MVMEAPPSPQCVGREFVRQYYTLLNKAPAHLHRFYNNNSSFVHGGLDAPNRETKPVVGQKQIHQKIQQLNFHDCHAKISQVDSQATLGDGVVVQVTGELSNSGQPMRRFTQTFVLAAQSPKKYYVHNDIFRYQDVIFSDEEVEQDSGRSEPEEDNEPDLRPTSDVIQPRVQQPPSAGTGVAYYNSTGPVPTGVSPTNVTAPPATVSPAAPVATLPPQQPSQQQQVQPQQVGLQVQTQQQPLQIPLQQQVTVAANAPSAPVQAAPVPEVSVAPILMSNGNHPDEVGPSSTPITPLQDEAVLPDSPDDQAADGEVRDSVAPDEDKTPMQENLEDSQQLNESASSEPKTYATLVKCGGIGVGTSSFATMATNAVTSVKPTSSPPPMVQHGVDSQPGSGGPGLLSQGQRGARARGGGGNIRGVVRPDRTSGAGRGSFTDDNGNVGADGDRRRMGTNMQQYPDSQQLFLGNIPHHATEDDLRELFSTYGTIVNLRIHTKPNTGNRPNYGFIIFEEASTVQTLLNKRPIFFHDQKLNVEEKKTTNRLRMDQQGRGGGSGGDSVMVGGGRVGTGGVGSGSRGGGMMRGGGAGLGHHRGGGRGGFGRGDGRGGGIPRGGYNRR